jgi:N-acyl-D-amino-acid deacylase
MGIRALAVYGTPARKVEFAKRIDRAAAWLAGQAPLSTEDRVMQLLGLKWAGTDARARETRTRELLAAQRADGGWAQTPYLGSDAYATGQVLFALREMGVPATNAALQRGTGFLLRTQDKDGSWHVISRAMKIQPYFESGFPYGHDQWISQTATSWATMALSLTAQEPPVVAAASPAR